MIPFNRPVTTGTELAHLSQVLQSNKWCGDGALTLKCQKLIEKHSQVKKALLTTSCTDALEMTGLLADLKPGDEVIVPAYTFVSSINAFVLRGAIPVFVDIRPDTLNINEALIEEAITPKTKLIVVVHYAGVGCEMDAINALAKKHNITVVEDNAHGFLGKYKNKALGSIGRFATLSFHETKNIPAGEGGCLLLNDEKDILRAEIIREKGTNRRQFLNGTVDKYTWLDLGSSFLPSEFISAVLLSQLEHIDSIQKQRARIWSKYNTALKSWAQSKDVRLPIIPSHCEQSYHMFYMVMPNGRSRDGFMNFMKDQGITVTSHYQPLQLSDMGKKFGCDKKNLPVTIATSQQIVRLPLWNALTDAQVETVISNVIKFDFPRENA
jgi:dTDP-4-amino-4,6-dideoxygalactose transaminase